MRLMAFLATLLLVPSIAFAQVDFPTIAGAAGVDPSGATDSTAGIQAVLAANPKGTIVAPMPSVAYKIAGTLKLNKAQQLLCAQGATFTCTNTAGACMVIADPSAAYEIADITGCTLNGPGAGGNASVGIFLGGDPAGVISPKTYFADGATMHNVHISGFNSGLKFGNNTWTNRIEGSQIGGNGYSIYAPAGVTDAGEDTAIIGSTIFNSSVGIQDDGGFDFKLTGVSLDFNAYAAAGVNLFLSCDLCHFETGGGYPFFSNPYGSVVLRLTNTDLQFDNTTGTDIAMAVLYPQNAIIRLSQVQVWSGHPVTDLLWVSTASLPSPVISLSQITSGGVAHMTNNSANPNLSTFGVTGIAP